MSEFQSCDLAQLKALAHSKALEWVADFAKKPQLILLLEGPMGAGKTQFTRFFIEALGAENASEIASPSYALHHHYKTDSAPVDHFDLYRLQSEDELESIAFWDFFSRSPTPRIVLIEWADRLRELGVEGQLPRSWRKVKLTFREHGLDRREIQIQE